MPASGKRKETERRREKGKEGEPMQKITIKQVIRNVFDIIIEKFDEFVYVGVNGDAHVFLRDFFDEQEAKHKNYKWIIDRDLRDREYVAISSVFLKKYYFKGDPLGGPCESINVNPLPILRRGVKNRMFQNRIYNDGYLYFRNKPILRPVSLEQLWESYYHIDKIVSVLKKNPKISDLRVVETKYYSIDDCGSHQVKCLYTPTPWEFEEWQKDGKFWTCHCSLMAVESMKLDKYRRDLSCER
ncbi:MAG: hypothetical protein WC375_07885 [Methanomassiliicoccales archaeon]|jgi:hypothetical protein